MSKPIPFELLICPSCKSENIKQTTHDIVCNNCKKAYKNMTQQYRFVDYGDEQVTDTLDKIKFIVKKNRTIYDFIMKVLGPVYFDTSMSRFLKKYVKSKNKIAINLGSGNSDISKEVSNVDIFPYGSVNITCDIANLPLKTNSIDVIINSAVLEHVPNPEKVVAEIHRVLKKGGIVYSFFPFMQGFHASPYDFSRRTIEGMKVLYKDFDIIEVKPSGGPTSGFLWVFQEWLAILLSFGIKPLHQLIWSILLVTLWPIKFLDIILLKHPMAHNISSGFVLIGKKSATQRD